MSSRCEAVVEHFLEDVQAGVEQRLADEAADIAVHRIPDIVQGVEGEANAVERGDRREIGELRPRTGRALPPLKAHEPHIRISCSGTGRTASNGERQR